MVWTIARNRMRTALRRYRRRKEANDANVSPPTPEERAMASHEHDLIRLAMSALSLKDRELLWMREVEGLEYEEIGTRLGATVGTVRVACHRARKRLEEAFRRLEDGR